MNKYPVTERKLYLWCKETKNFFVKFRGAFSFQKNFFIYSYIHVKHILLDRRHILRRFFLQIFDILEVTDNFWIFLEIFEFKFLLK